MALFKNGKYAGQSFEKIAADDRGYSASALREERDGGGQLSRNLAGFVKYVKQRHGGVMTIGKHRGLYRQGINSIMVPFLPCFVVVFPSLVFRRAA